MVSQFVKFIFNPQFRALILGSSALLFKFSVDFSVFLAFIFFLWKFIRNLKKKIVDDIKKKTKNAKSLYEGVENMDDSSKKKNKSQNESVPEPANVNVVSQYTGIARRSGEYNNKIFNKLEDQINRLLVKDYGENYMEILDRFDYLLTLKMLDNTLNVDFNDEKQMLSKIEKINKYGDAKKFIEEMKNIVSLEMPNNNM